MIVSFQLCHGSYSDVGTNINSFVPHIEKLRTHSEVLCSLPACIQVNPLLRHCYSEAYKMSVYCLLYSHVVNGLIQEYLTISGISMYM